MRGMKVMVSAAVVSLAPVAFESASAASDPTGIWMNDTGRGAIEIKHCGDMLCGNVVWVKNATDAQGCGKQIIGNVASVGGGRWDNGWIYSPERGRKYSVELTPLDNGTLRVTGYAGLKFLSKTMIWTRAPENLHLCGETVAKSGRPVAEPAGDATAAAKTDAQEAKPATTKSDTKPSANPQVAAAAPGPKSLMPGPSSAAPAASGSHDAAQPGSPINGANDTAKPQAAPAPAAPAQDAAKEPAPDDKTASAENGEDSDLEVKLDGLGLGKVFTKTKSGKCKVDLPWVKVTVDCDE